jgi:manganese-dependent inorganic pyrophosphatase
MYLKSATTTPTDSETVSYLSRITGLDPEALSKDLRDAMNQLGSRPADELVKQDLKLYNEAGISYSVSQVESASLDIMAQRRDEFLAVLESLKAEKNLLFASLMVTDVTRLDSALLVSSGTFAKEASFPRPDEEAAAANTFLLKGVVSRKKQLIPLLSEMVERMQKEGKL